MDVLDDLEENLHEKHLWSEFLQAVRDNSCNQIGQRRSILVLGDSFVGKTSLLSSFGVTDVRRGNGLEYHCVDIKEEGRHENMKLSIWIADGDPSLSYLLSYSLTEKSFADTLAVLVVSMEEPWNILDSLQNWADILENQVKRLKLSQTDMQEFRDSLLRHFRSYVEPDLLLGNEHLEGGPRSNVSKMVMSTSIHGNLSMNSPVDAAPRMTTIVENPLHPSLHSCGLLTAAALQQGKSRGLFNGPPRTSASDDESVTEPSAGDTVSDGLLMLPPGVLEKNLGIPIVVVVTKVDCMAPLKQSHNYTDEYFDFIQMHIRQFCLKYGAALVYTSLKEDKNCALLNQYLRHRVFGLPFQHSAYVVEADSVFVPCGWDNPKKISILHRNLVHLQPTQAYSEVVPKPSNYFTRQGSLRHHRGDPEIVAEDEQTLLARLAAAMSKQQGPGATPQPAGASLGMGESGGRVPSGGLSPRASGGSPGDALGPYPPSKMPGMRMPHGGPGAVGSANTAASAAAGATPGSTDRVLTSFFKSLLTKERTGAAPVTPSSPSHLPSSEQASSLVTDAPSEKE